MTPARSPLHVQVIGLCRFSVPSLGAFQVEHDTIEARRAMLYSPTRLAQRFVWFEQVFLPCIRHQTDANFTMIVLLGEDFPEPWLSRMRAAVADVPQIVLEFAPPLHHREICANAMARHVDPSVFAVAEYRLDDDDAIATTFTARLRREAYRLTRLITAVGVMGVDFCKGVVLSVRNAEVTLAPRHALQWTPGLAVISKPGAPRHILDWPHHVMWQQMPIVTFPDEIMFLRGAHDTNDSSTPKGSNTFRLQKDDWQAVLQNRFGIDLDQFRAAITALDAAQ